MTDMTHIDDVVGSEDKVSPLFVFLALGGFWVLLGIAGFFALA